MYNCRFVVQTSSHILIYVFCGPKAQTLELTMKVTHIHTCT